VGAGSAEDIFSLPGLADDTGSSVGADDQPLNTEPAEIAQMMRLLNEGEFDQAIALTARLRDPKLRARFNSLVYLRAAAGAIDKGDYETALRLAQDLTDPRQRVLVFIQVARQFQEKKENFRAIEVLRRAAQATVGAPNKHARVRALLTVANAVASLETGYGFELMEAAVAALNQARTSKEKEEDSDLDSQEFEQGLAILAKTNFDRAWRLARTIECQEISFSAQLAVCKAGLPN